MLIGVINLQGVKITKRSVLITGMVDAQTMKINPRLRGKNKMCNEDCCMIKINEIVKEYNEKDTLGHWDAINKITETILEYHHVSNNDLDYDDDLNVVKG